MILLSTRKADKEELYENSIRLKQIINLLKQENDFLKTRLMQMQEQWDKNQKFMQRLAHKSNIPEDIACAYKESSLISMLKKKIKAYEVENALLKKDIFVVTHDMKFTKQGELEAMNKALEQECIRLRRMLESNIKQKDTTQDVLEQKVIIEDLMNQVTELKYQLNKTREAELHALDKLKALEDKEMRKQKVRGMNQKEEIEKMKDKIEKLTYEKNLLEAQLEEMNNQKQEIKVANEIIGKLNEQLKELKKKNTNLINSTKMYEKKLIEKDKAIRDAINNAKDKENEYVLKMLEDKESYMQKILRLELQLKHQYNNKPISNKIKLVNLNDLKESIGWFRVIVIKHTWNEIKSLLFSEYELSEHISIKELTKLFKKQPLLLKDSELLARYLIEPIEYRNIEYSIYRDCLLSNIITLLELVLDIEAIKDIDAIVRNGLGKIRLKNTEELRNGLDFSKWLLFCNQYYLTPLEIACIGSLMSFNDSQQLSVEVLLNTKYKEYFKQEIIVDYNDSKEQVIEKELIINLNNAQFTNEKLNKDTDKVAITSNEKEAVDSDIIINENKEVPDYITPFVPLKNNYITEEEPNKTNELLIMNEPQVIEDGSFNEPDAVSSEIHSYYKPNKDDTLKAKELSNGINERHKEIITEIKDYLTNTGTTLSELIKDKVFIAKTEDNQGYEVIMIEDLMILLNKIIELEALNQLKDLFKSFTDHKEDYILVHILLYLFDEIETNELTEESLIIITKLLEYLEETNTKVMDVFKEVIYQQSISIEEESTIVEVIELQDFYSILGKLNITKQEDRQLSEYLQLDKDYPNILLVGKLQKLVENMV